MTLPTLKSVFSLLQTSLIMDYVRLILMSRRSLYLAFRQSPIHLGMSTPNAKHLREIGMSHHWLPNAALFRDCECLWERAKSIE